MSAGGRTGGAARQRFVIHLSVEVADLAAAHLLARAVTRSLAFLPELQQGETTVSEEGDLRVQHQVFCDRLLGGGRRCVLRPGHVGGCLSERHAAGRTPG